MKKHRVYTISFASVYPHYVAKPNFSTLYRRARSMKAD